MSVNTAVPQKSSQFHVLISFTRDVIPMEAAPNADNDANAVVFNLGASVIRMDLDRSVNKPVLKMTSWLRMSWMDFRLKWNPEVLSAFHVYFRDILENEDNASLSLRLTAAFRKSVCRPARSGFLTLR